MSRSRRGRLALASLVLLAAIGAAPATAGAEEDPGGIGLRLVEAPAATQDDPRARLYIVDHLAPGTVIERRVEVSNSTTSMHEVDLYASAATIQDGVFLGDDGNTPNELSRWTSVTPGTVDIAAGETLSAVIKIDVPDDAAPGEQYGVVWAEVRSATASGSVSQVNRVGIRLYISVGPGGAPAPDFEVESLTPSRSTEGAPVVTAAVRNTGGRALDVAGTLMLTNGPGGLSAGPFPAVLSTTIAIGDTSTVTITLDDSVPAGPWDAVVALESGLTKRRGEATITFPAVGAAAAVATDAPSGPPWGAVVDVAAVAALSLLGLRIVRRARRGKSTRPRVAGPACAIPTSRGLDFGSVAPSRSGP